MATSLGWFIPCTLALAAGGAAAQPHTASCINSGSSAVEPLDGASGHALQVVTLTCVHSGGAVDGAVSTLEAIWEVDMASSKLVSAHAVARKPGALAAYRITEGVLQPVMKQGKPAGWTATGKGVYLVGSGTAAALSGRSFSWMARLTGPRLYAMDFRLDD